MCNNVMVFFYKEKYSLYFDFYVIDIAISMSDFDNFDIDQISSKLAQR